MQILPPEGKGGPLAIGLLVIALLLAYFLGFHWFFAGHKELNEQTASLLETEARFRARAAAREDLLAELERVRGTASDSVLFLPEDNFSLGAAALVTRLKETVAQQAQDTQRCQVVSTQDSRSVDPEPFQKVTIKVRMRCDLEDVVAVFQAIEGGAPVMFLENVNLFLDRSLYVRQAPNLGFLDIRFDLSGYLRIAVEGAR